MTTKPKRDLTQGNVAKNIWHLALPIMVTSALLDIFNIVDMIFVGRLGPEAIAAVSICGVLMGIIRMGAMGISTGTVALVSRYVGSKDHNAARGALNQSITLSIATSLAIAVLGYFFAAPLLRALGAAEEVVPHGVAYFRIMCVGSITMFLSIILSAGMRGFGDATTPMIAMGIASLLNIGLDPLLIFGIGPFPRLEVAGSAVATVFSRGIGSIILLIMLSRQEGGIRLLATRGNGQVSYIGKILKIGSFSALRSLSMNISRVVLVRIVAVFGTFAVASFGIGMRLRIFVLILGFGLANATAVNVGQNLGNNRPDRAEKAAWLSVGFFAVFIVLISVLFLTIPGAIIGIFNKQPEVVKFGRTFLLFFVPSLFFMDLSIVLGRAIDGAGNTRATMLITFISLIVIGIPMAFIFSRLWGVNGIWAALVGSNAIQGIGAFFWFRTGRWKMTKV